jgi:hypothetical protein
VEQISPELALVDPDLAARARRTLPDPSTTAPRTVVSTTAPSVAEAAPHRAYPFWARVTAALWLLVLGILIGGAAIPHAQDRPRVVPAGEDPAFCPVPADSPSEPSRPGP